jgi:HAD superfamily hydrolase (TIGR01509 family)
LFRLRRRIRLRPVGFLLVRRRKFSPADAGRSRRLSVPGLPAAGRGEPGERVGNMMPHWDIKAVLLDMDGTLLDTEKVYLESLVSALAAFGYSDGVVTLCQAMVGIPALECEAMLRARYGEDFPLSQLRQAFNARRDEILGSGLPLKSGAIDLLDALRETALPLAIVTSSSRRTADEHLTLAGIRTRFETIVTRDDVIRGKPSPDLYLLAASRFGVKPEFCLAIEDSNPGVATAHAAGALTLMVPDIVPPTEESRAKCAAVLPDLGAVLTMLRQQDRLKHPSTVRGSIK